MDRPRNLTQLNISRLRPLPIKSPTQSLDYRGNSDHIHLSILGFHGYGEEISQICPCPFRPINTSFLGTPSPSHHSTTCFPSGGTVRELQELQQELPPTNHKFSIFFPARRWPSTSSSLRLAYCPFSVHLLYQSSSAIFLTESFFFLFFFSFPKISRIWLTISLFLPINPTSNALVHLGTWIPPIS